MKNDDLMPLSDDLQRLLLAEKAAPPMPGALQAKDGQRLAESIARPPVGGEGGDAGGGEPVSADPGVPGGDAMGGADALADLSPLASLAAKPLLLAASTFAVGVGVGVGTTLLLSSEAPPKPQPVVVQAADAGISVLPTLDAQPMIASIDAGQVQAAPQPTAKPSTPNFSKDHALAAERSLLELSRTAITRGDAKTALKQLQRHARMHRRGRLAEERDALWVQALVLDRSYEKARARAQRFKKRYPQSLFLPVVEHVMAELP